MAESARQAGEAQEDPFDSLLSLEDSYYRRGYDEGYVDGQRQARVEARLFGMQTAFEKFTSIGKIHARAQLWAARLKLDPKSTREQLDADARTVCGIDGAEPLLPSIQPNARLEKHIEALLSLSQPAQMPLDNSDSSVAEADIRLRRAQAKEKIVEKMLGEETATHEPLEIEFTSQRQPYPKEVDRSADLGDFGTG